MNNLTAGVSLWQKNTDNDDVGPGAHTAEPCSGLSRGHCSAAHGSLWRPHLPGIQNQMVSLTAGHSTGDQQANGDVLRALHYRRRSQ